MPYVKLSIVIPSTSRIRRTFDDSRLLPARSKTRKKKTLTIGSLSDQGTAIGPLSYVFKGAPENATRGALHTPCPGNRSTPAP